MILLHRSANVKKSSSNIRNRTNQNNPHDPAWLLQSRYRNRSFVISKPRTLVLKDTTNDKLNFLRKICRRIQFGMLLVAFNALKPDIREMAMKKMLNYLKRMSWMYYFYQWKLNSGKSHKGHLISNIFKRMQSQWLAKGWNQWLFVWKQYHKQQLIKDALNRIMHISRIGLLWHAWLILSQPGPSMIQFIRRKVGHCNCVYELVAGNKQHHCGFEKHLLNRVKLLRWELDKAQDSQYRGSRRSRQSLNSLDDVMRKTPSHYQQKRHPSCW